MKNQNYIKLLLTSLLLTPCFLFPKYEESEKQGKLNIKDSNDFAPKIKVNFSLGSKTIRIIFVKIKTTFLNSNVNYLVDINNNKVLDGLVYSFLLAPTSYNDGPPDSLTGFGKILSLEVKEEMKDKIVVKEFSLVNKDGSSIGLKFDKPNNTFGIPHREESQRKGYKYAYSRGILKNDSAANKLLGKIINAQYDNKSKKWQYLYLKIILEKEVDGKKEYIVKINPYIFNELVKHFKKTYIDNNDNKATKKDYENILNEQIPYLPVNDN